MEEYKVLITTSGIGSRLGNLTKHTNKSLVRVGKKPALSYIIESYPKNVEIVLTVGYYGNHVKQFISLAYPDRNIKFVDVNNYNGEGSSLAYSILQAKEFLQCPFIFHASDTIIQGGVKNIDYFDEDWIAVCEKEDCSEYRTVSLCGNINEKGNLDSNLAYMGLAGIQNYESFWNNLENIYSEDSSNRNLSDCHVFNRMNLKWKLVKYSEDKWLDTGNSFGLKRSRSLINDKFHLLDKDDESIFLFDDFVIKFFANSETCENRVKRALDLRDVTPELESSTENFYKYKYAKGELLADCVNSDIFVDFLKWSKENVWIARSEDKEFEKICFDFYFNKTEKRINQFRLSSKIVDEELVINGRKIPPLSYLLNSIDKDLLCTDKTFRFHGDFILDNIIYNKGKFTLLDWRQDFGGSIFEGDIYYDLAKLNHNLILNHDILFKELFHVHRKENRIECDILRSERLINCKEIYDEWLLINNFDLKKVNVLTSLIWLNMCPLHDSKMGEFLYYFGIFNLHKSLFVCNLNCL